MPKRLNIATLVMLNPEGEAFSSGGLQRWCRDLALLGRDKGYEVTVYQKATRPFQKEIAEGVCVKGLVCPLSFKGNWKFSRLLARYIDPEDPIIFVSQELALSNSYQRAVAVNHGIWWDGDRPALKRWFNKRLQYRLINRLRGVICVDTNYINWCHAELPNRKLWEKKLHYVPNYGDLDVFKPDKQRSSSEDGLTILFPRRITDETLDRGGRGGGLFCRALEVLAKRDFKARALFVGPGRQQSAIRDWAAARGMENEVEVYDVAMDEMPSVYARADVVVVPSIEHEGTSLSAVEALVSGIPTVVSHIGGLGNIVIDGFNGHICNLTAESLADAIQRAAAERLLDDPRILSRCRESLGKPRWERQVWKVLEDLLEL